MTSIDFLNKVHNFYITKEDLAARRFDRIWLILQCY